MRLRSLLMLLPIGATLLFGQNRPTPFQPDSAMAMLKVLSGDIGPRTMGSPAEQRALAYALERFRAFGLDEVRLMDVTRTPASRRGVTRNTHSGIAVGVLRGATDRTIIIGGHIDSASPEVPGTNDDGSGAAVVLECARVMAQREWHSSIVFCLFGGEESGLIGSQAFVEQFPDLDRTDLMLQVDMANGGTFLIPFIDTDNIEAPSWLLRAAYEEFSSLGHQGLYYPVHFFTWNIVSGGGAGSDHEPFQRRGIPAIDFTSDASDPIHTPQDNLAWFRPGGLERSGDLVYRLVGRFDNGTPAERTGSYMTTQWGSALLLLPMWSLWTFLVVSTICGGVVYILLRRRRTELRGTPRPRIPGLKAAGGFLLIWIVVWSAENAVGLVAGWRSPWYDEPLWSLLPAIACGLASAILVGWWSRRWAMSHDATRYALRSFVWHVIVIAATAIVSPRLASYFAAGLLFSAISWLVRPAWLRVLLLAVGSYPVVRLLTPELFPFLARAIAMIPLSGFLAEVSLSLGFAVFALILTLPIVYSWLSLLKDPEVRWPFKHSYQDGGVIATACIVAIAAVFVAAQKNAYTDYHPRAVKIQHTVIAGEDTTSTTVTSAEYLRDLRFVDANGDTLSAGGSTTLNLPNVRTEAGHWLRVADNGWQSVDSNASSSLVTIEGRYRPYTLTVRYEARTAAILSADAGMYAVNRTEHTASVEYYSFPDMPMTIPVTLRLSGADTVTQTVEATFVEPAAAVSVLGGPVNIERRTTIRSTRSVIIPTSSSVP